ncbi:MAG: hypothetical protein QM820_08930 [Minicystis sp.]
MGLVRASLDYECDWRFGFNLEASGNGTLGYLLFWSGCGGLNLSKDITVPNPFTSQGQTIVTGSAVKCIGLIESFVFPGEEDDPIRITAYVSKDAAANIRAKLARPVTSTKLQLAWYIISFDEDRDQWYEAAYIDGQANADANIDTSNGDLQISIANKSTQIAENIDIRVFKFEFQIIPAAGTQSVLQFATGVTQRLVKNWGAPT